MARYKGSAERMWIDLKRLRENRGWLQQEAAERLGINRVYLSALENGKHGVSKQMMQRIIQVFGVSEGDFDSPPQKANPAPTKAVVRKKEIPVLDDKDTRKRILDISAKLFALKGFKAVSLKDIARAVSIRVPSIYYYYADKDALIHDVLTQFEKAYMRHHDKLKRMNERALTVEDVVDNLFNASVMAKQDPIACLGMSMTLKEQYNNEAAFEYSFKMMYEGGINTIKAGFDGLVDKGVIPPSDTMNLAMLYMFWIMSVNEVYMHELVGLDAPVDASGVQHSLRTIVTNALTQGLLKADRSA